MPFNDIERAREYRRRYYREHKAERSKYNRQYRQKYKDELSATKRDYYQKHREEIRAKQRPDTKERLLRKQEYERHYRAAHKEVRQAAGKKSYLKNRAAILVRRNNRKRASLEAEALRPKPECCDACGGVDRIVFDHCHQRGVFRGWLCHYCNVILGMAKDDPNRLRKLIAYLERTKDLTTPQLVLPGV